MRHVVGVGNQLKTKRRPRSDCVQLFVKLGKNKPEPPNDESGSKTSQKPVRLGKAFFTLLNALASCGNTPVFLSTRCSEMDLAASGVQCFLQGSLRPNPKEAIRDLAAFKNQNRWDAADPILRGDTRVVINVHFANLQRRILFGQFINHWRDLAARPAPRSPKINQNCPVCREDF